MTNHSSTPTAKPCGCRFVSKRWHKGAGRYLYAQDYGYKAWFLACPAHR